MSKSSILVGLFSSSYSIYLLGDSGAFGGLPFSYPSGTRFLVDICKFLFLKLEKL